MGSLPEIEESVVARPKAREEAFKAKLTHSQEMLKRKPPIRKLSAYPIFNECCGRSPRRSRPGPEGAAHRAL